MNKPNLIYILADDMGVGDVSALNENCGFVTPNLDKMCENGIAFTDAHSTSSVCTPSRYGIMTGRYNWRSVLKKGVLGGYSNALIEKGRSTVADVLKRNGYYTSMIGKWHLGMDFPKNFEVNHSPGLGERFDLDDGIDYSGKIENSPITNGFDYYFGISASLDIPPYVYIENDKFTDTPDHISQTEKGLGWFRAGPCAKDFVHENVLDELCDKVLDEIENHCEDPFFIYFPMPAPHGPILPTDKFKGKSNTNGYGDFVLQCDDVVGRIMSKLEEKGIIDDTIVIYTADNGCSPAANLEELYELGHNPNYVYRGHKADIFEGGHRIPFIASWGNGMPKGERCDRTICQSDIMATMAEILGDKLADNEGEDSISNLPLWNNPKTDGVRTSTVHQSINGSLSLRKGKFKLEMCADSGGWSFPRPNTDESVGLPEFQLYDLENDIGETKNVIEEFPEVYKEMREELKAIVLSGRTSVGEKQENNGEKTWETVKWIEE